MNNNGDLFGRTNFYEFKYFRLRLAISIALAFAKFV